MFSEQVEDGNLVEFVSAQIDPSNVTRKMEHVSSQAPKPEDKNHATQETITPRAPIYSQCERVNILEIKSCESGVPILIPLINAFLHFQTSQDVLDNWHYTSNLHGVVSHFANLGPWARLYLLRTRTLSRLLRLLL